MGEDEDEPASDVTSADEAAGEAAGEAAADGVVGDVKGVAGAEEGAAPRAANRGETRPLARGAPSKPGDGPREARERPSPGAGKAATSEGTC